MNKESLKQKELRLRNELNEASDEFEKQFVKTAGIALIGGIISYGIYKLFKPKKTDEPQLQGENAKPVLQENVSSSTDIGKYVNIGTSLIRIVSAVAPLIISAYNKETEE